MSVTLNVGDVLNLNVFLVRQLITAQGEKEHILVRVVDVIEHDGMQSLVLGLNEKDT